MKKSFIITVNNFMKKTAIFLSCAVAVIFLFNLGVVGSVFSAMAHEALMQGDYHQALSAFSFNGESMLCMLVNRTKIVEYPESIPLEKEEKTETQKKNDKPLNNENEPANVDFSKEKSSISVVDNNIIVSNAAKKTFDIRSLLSMPLQFTNSEGYKVLIIHTHTTESYMPDDRSEDQSKNIVRVGDEFEKVLNEHNIKTLHIKTVHDAPYSKSYINELKTIQSVLKDNPSIQVIIDVHRDALYNSKNEKIKPVVTINNEKAAQVMLVCGSDAMGLPHSTWQSCFSFALKVQNDMNKNHPGLARPVNLREERFNTHMTENSVIFEIGANGNTLQEAVLGGHYAAESIANVLNNKNQ